jgi:hypothetical protein
VFEAELAELDRVSGLWPLTSSGTLLAPLTRGRPWNPF